MAQEAFRTGLERPKRPPRRLKRPPDVSFVSKTRTEPRNSSRKLLFFLFQSFPRERTIRRPFLAWANKEIQPTGVQDVQKCYQDASKRDPGDLVASKLASKNSSNVFWKRVGSLWKTFGNQEATKSRADPLHTLSLDLHPLIFDPFSMQSWIGFEPFLDILFVHFGVSCLTP